MSFTHQFKFTRANDEQKQSVVALLRSENLPVIDLPERLDNFYVSYDDTRVIAAIGLEQYGRSGLLRSLVVAKAYRSKGIASYLVKLLENEAKTLGISSMYLLTETAPQYFEKIGYHRISREEVPAALKTSSEFSHVCPVSAIVMKKNLSQQ